MKNIQIQELQEKDIIRIANERIRIEFNELTKKLFHLENEIELLKEENIILNKRMDMGLK